ncbi:MAG TPA: radical SAM protein [Acidimicrobiales bacterium]
MSPPSPGAPTLTAAALPPRLALPTPTVRRLQVEVTGACNLACRMCLVRYRPALDRETAAFPLDRFEALLDRLPALEEVTLQGLGEPLLHPDLPGMVAAASRRGLRVGFNTNGTLLTHARIDALLDAGLSWVHVSVDGATAATFERIRDGARLRQVVRNLRRLVEHRDARGGAPPHVQLNTVLMRSNLAELPDVVRLAADIGVDRMWLQALSHDFSDTGGDVTYVAIRGFTETEAVWGDGQGEAGPVSEARRVAAELGLDLRLPDQPDPPADGSPDPDTTGEPVLPCDWPWTGMYVTHDGKVQPCCMVMGDDRVVLGDLRTEQVDDVWRGRAYEEFRRALCSDEPPDVCRGCSWYRRVF